MAGSIVFFFAVTALLGHGLIALVTGRRRVTAETCVVAPGVGLGLFACLSVALNSLGAPLVWWSFLAAGLAFEGAGQLRASSVGASRRVGIVPEEAEEERARHVAPLLVAVLLGALLLIVMLHGEFSAAYLNDDDSWEHAATAKYIAVHHTYSISPEIRPRITSYLEPYPPGYPALIAVCHQLNHSLSWTLRFFNALLVALAVPWFYAAAKEYTRGNPKPEARNSNREAPGNSTASSSFGFRISSFRPGAALWMTGVLAVLPCFMSHFVWAQTLAVTLFFPAFYALERCRREPAWAVMAAVAIAAIALTQPSAAAVFGMMAALAWLAHLVSACFRKGEPGRWNAVIFQAAAAAGALVIAAAFFVPEYVKFGHNEFYHGIGKIPAPPPPAPGEAPAPKTSVDFTQMTGTGFGVTYSLWDVAFAPGILNKINQPTGIGLVLFAVAAAGVVLALAGLRRLPIEPHWLIMLLWLGLGVAGIEGNRTGVALFPFRFWVFFAVPVAMLAGEFLAWLAAKLSWPLEALAAAAGAALGGVLVFSNLAERLDVALEGLGGPPPETAMTSPALLIVSLLALAAAVGTAIYLIGNARRAGKDASPEEARPSFLAPALGFAAIVLLVGGVAMTSAWGKVQLQGSTPFPPGVRFYMGPVTGPDGRQYLAREGPELQGYAEMQRELDPDTPVFVLNGPDDHAVGFDLWALPYDNEILALRSRVDVVDPWMRPHRPVADEKYLKDAVALAKAKGFRFVMVDLWRAADRQQDRTVTTRALVDTARAHKINEARLNALLIQKAPPTAEEAKVIATLRDLFDSMQFREDQEHEAFEIAEQLRGLMARSNLLAPKPTIDKGAYGITLYEIKDPAER